MYQLHEEWQSTNEIDLKDFFLILWKGKKIIFLCLLLFGAIGSGYAFSQQEWWTSKAVVSVPKINQIGPFVIVTKRYQEAFESDLDSSLYDISNINNINNINNISDSGAVLKLFIQTFNLAENKYKFLITNKYFSEAKAVFFQDKIVDERSERILMKEWMSRIKAEKNEDGDEYTLSVQSVMDTNSFYLLTEYINFTNQMVTKDLIVQLASLLEIKKMELEWRLESRLNVLKNEIKLEIIRTEYALKIAQAAKSKGPLENWSKEGPFSISLGSDGIEAKIKVLKSIDNLSVMDSSIELSAAKIALLNEGPKLTETIQTVNFLERPEMPLERDIQQRALIVILALSLGGALGVLVVLSRKAFS